MTEGYQPPTAPGSASGIRADQDTTTLPKVSTPTQGAGQRSDGWSTTTPSSGRGASADAGRYAANATTTATPVSSRTAAGDSESSAGPSSRASSGRGARQPRRARLTLSHLNVYSVFKFSCVLAIVLFFVWLIMIGVLYSVLDFAGVFGKINDTVHTISGDAKTGDVVTPSLVFGGAFLIGAVNIVLFVAMSTIGSMIYNLCADLVGGVEVTLSERE